MEEDVSACKLGSSIADSCSRNSRADVPLIAAETYLNRYKNGWIASSLASKQFYDDCAKKRGRLPAGAMPFLPQSEMPVPVPVSRFPWPQVIIPSMYPDTVVSA